MPVALSLFLVLFFLLMNAFFVAAEFSLVRVRKSQVEILVDEDRSGAKYTKLVADNVNAYLSACQLGITLASLALGWLGEPAVSQLIEGPLLADRPARGGHPRHCRRHRLRRHHRAAHRGGRAHTEVARHLLHGALRPVHRRAARVVLPHHVPHHVAVQQHHERGHEAARPRHRPTSTRCTPARRSSCSSTRAPKAASSIPSRTSTWTTSSTWATRTPRPS